MITRSHHDSTGLMHNSHLVIGLAAASLLGTPLLADIDVSLQPVSSGAAVGETVRFECYLSSPTPQEYCCATISLDWDPERLRLIGCTEEGAEATQMAWWPEMSVPWTLNEEVPPQDGTGLYIVLASLGSDQMADPDGALMTTFEFETLAPGIAEVRLSTEGPGIEDATIVWDGVVPNLQVTGELISGSVTVGSSAQQSCPSDITGDSTVGVDDMLEVFASWQSPYTVDDLVAILMNFGPCGQ